MALGVTPTAKAYAVFVGDPSAKTTPLVPESPHLFVVPSLFGHWTLLEFVPPTSLPRPPTVQFDKL